VRVSGGLSVRDLSREFIQGDRSNVVLRQLSFEVAAGEVVALFGPNGCGKSTLFQILAGLDPDHQGAVQLGDRALPDASIGYLFQNFSASLFPWLTLSENIAFPQQMRTNGRAPEGESPDTILARFGLRDFSKHYPYQVSGGMQQRVCFGRTFATRQDLLLLDEPFSALDTRGVAQMLQAFEEMSARHRPPTMLICHDLDQAMLFADRIFVLSPRPARIVEDVRLPFKRPREVSLLLDPEFQRLRGHIVETRLKAETASS
jgi:NitT/TauT family transport system ATP-binding protein